MFRFRPVGRKPPHRGAAPFCSKFRLVNCLTAIQRVVSHFSHGCAASLFALSQRSASTRSAGKSDSYCTSQIRYTDTHTAISRHSPRLCSGSALAGESLHNAEPILIAQKPALRIPLARKFARVVSVFSHSRLRGISDSFCHHTVSQYTVAVRVPSSSALLWVSTQMSI